MKCLLVSDLHYALKQFDWLVSVAHRFDAIVIAGDQVDGRSHVYMRVQVPVILKYLQRLQTHARLLVSSGNHDLDIRGEHGERVARWMESVRAAGIPTDGDSVEAGETLFTICPWWDGPRTRDLVAAQLAGDAAKPKKRWVWVYHGPPDESPTSWTGTRHYGDAELLRWIRELNPDIVLTGHIHEAPFVTDGSWVDRIGSTWVFNAGRHKGAFPPHISLDLERDTALWCCEQGFERVELGRSFAGEPVPCHRVPAWLETMPGD